MEAKCRFNLLLAASTGIAMVGAGIGLYFVRRRYALIESQS